jgi:hypothetical protein
MEEATVKIRAFEKKIRERDGITVVIRARKTAEIRNYRESQRTQQWRYQIISTIICTLIYNAYEFTIIDGFGNEPTAGSRWVP